MDNGSKRVYKQIIRENRVRQLELVLTIVTTLAVVFLSFAIIVLGIIKIQDNYYKPTPIPTPTSIPTPYPMPEVTPEGALESV
jgi:uncharacterized BrkB/YihY/UPF0761 family membrane protein